MYIHVHVMSNDVMSIDIINKVFYKRHYMAAVYV